MNRTVGIVIIALLVLGLALYINAQRHDEEQWEDGTYTGRSESDERGYYGEIELVIADGEIKKAEYRELDQEDRIKDKDYPYQLGPQSHSTYEKRLIEAQNPDEVDAVSGATETQERFKEAAKRALENATKGNEGRFREISPPSPVSRDSEQREWKDGTYTAKTELDQHGFYGEIELQIADGKIVAVTYDEKDSEGKSKGEDYPYPLGPESEDKYAEQLLETQDPEKVDVIAGATETWEHFKETATEALKQAQ